METEITNRAREGSRNWKKCKGVLGQKDDSETEEEGIQNGDQASNTIRGRSVNYNEETSKTNWDQRDGNATMDVRSDTQRQDRERTHPRNNETDAGCQKITERRLNWYRHVLRRDE